MIRLFLLATLLSIFLNEAHASFDRNKEEAPKKSIFVQYTSELSKSWGNLHWYLNDPLISANMNIETEVEVKNFGVKNNYPDFSFEKISKYDLVIVPYSHNIRDEYIDDLSRFADQGGRLFLFQPIFSSTEKAKSFYGKLDIGYNGMLETTPKSSLLTGHQGSRILGIAPGKSVYPHNSYDGSLDFDPGSSIVLTRLSYNGKPDLFLDRGAQVCICATNLLKDLMPTDPDHPYNERNFRYLFINAVRALLGMEMFDQPVQKPYQEWSEFFYGYAAGKEYVVKASKYDVFAKRISTDSLNYYLNRADGFNTEAAKRLVAGDFDSCKELFDSGIRTLSGCMEKMTDVKVYNLRGWHSSVLTPDYYGGGLKGYAEVEWQDYLFNWMNKQMDWITKTGAKRLMDVYPNDWEILEQYYSKDISRIKRKIKEGYLEQGNGAFTAAYLPILSEETNIRQFRYGHKGIKDVLDANVKTFLCPIDHFHLHSQLPQILNSFGYENALLNGVKHPGRVDHLAAELIYWKGLDGSEIISVPRMKGVTEFSKVRNWFDPLPQFQADTCGYTSVYFGTPAFDATFDFVGSRESSLINPIAPVSGEWVFPTEYIEKARQPESSVFLGADKLWSYQLDFWSSWGCMNEASLWNRKTENKILFAEKFSSIARWLGHIDQTGAEKVQSEIDEVWKNLLRTQDHMMYGSVDYSKKIPADTITDAVGQDGKHHWGYDYPLLQSSYATAGNMENYVETRATNIGCPRISGSRYDRVKKYIDDSQAISENILSGSVNKIINEESGKFEAVTVFNQLGWAKKDIVTIEKDFKKGEIFNFQLFDNNNEVPVQITSKEQYEDGSLKSVTAIFYAEIPPLGYKTFVLEPSNDKPLAQPVAKKGAKKYSIENGFYIVEFDRANGGIKRIYDKELGKELLRRGRVGNELFSPLMPNASSADVKVTSIAIGEQGPIRTTIKVESKIDGVPYSASVSLPEKIKRIDFDLDIDYGQSGHNFGVSKKLESGLYLRFPLGLEGKFYINQPFGVYESQKASQASLDFASVSNGSFGVSLIHYNTPSIHYKGQDLSLCLARSKPLVVGKQNYRYSIYTHKNGPLDSDAFKVAKSVNADYAVFWSNMKAKSGDNGASFFDCDKTNIALSALEVRGETLTVRLYETNGKETDAAINLPFMGAAECKKVKLNNDEIERLKFQGGKVSVKFKPWEIVTLSFVKPN